MNKVYICHDCGASMRDENLITINTSWEEYYCSPIQTRTPYTYKTCSCGSEAFEEWDSSDLVKVLENVYVTVQDTVINNKLNKKALKELEILDYIEPVLNRINDVIKKINE